MKIYLIRIDRKILNESNDFYNFITFEKSMVYQSILTIKKNEMIYHFIKKYVNLKLITN
jgi:hypothetical protein